MGKKQDDSTKPDSNYGGAELGRNEESGPKAAEVQCPCYAGWEAFENNVRVVLRQLKTGSRAEKAHALHVFDDAMRILSRRDGQYVLESDEHKLDEKRACHFRSEARIEARRDRLIRKWQRHER